MFTNIHNAPAEGNFCNERGKAIKPQIVMDYHHHMGYVDKGDRMANSYSTGAHSNGRKNCSFICYTWPFSIATSFIPLVGVRRFHIEIFDLTS